MAIQMVYKPRTDSRERLVDLCGWVRRLFWSLANHKRTLYWHLWEL